MTDAPREIVRCSFHRNLPMWIAREVYVFAWGWCISRVEWEVAYSVSGIPVYRVLVWWRRGSRIYAICDNGKFKGKMYETAGFVLRLRLLWLFLTSKRRDEA